jgi:hypothetical protein
MNMNIKLPQACVISGDPSAYNELCRPPERKQQTCSGGELHTLTFHQTPRIPSTCSLPGGSLLSVQTSTQQDAIESSAVLKACLWLLPL